MALRGFLLCAHGMLFVLLPGYVMFLVLRRTPSVDRSLLWWGAGGMLVATLFQGFFTSLLSQLFPNSSNPMTWAAIGAMLMGLCAQGVTWLVLRLRRLAQGVLIASGAAVGLGMGLVYQIFQGFVLLGVGLKLIQGDISTPLAAEKASSSLPQIGLAAADSIMGRLAWLVFSAGLGMLVARALRDRRGWLFILAVLCHALVALVPPVIANVLGGWPDIAVWLELAFEALLLSVGWRWLNTQLPQVASRRTGRLKSGRAS